MDLIGAGLLPRPCICLFKALLPSVVHLCGLGVKMALCGQIRRNTAISGRVSLGLLHICSAGRVPGLLSWAGVPIHLLF